MEASSSDVQVELANTDTCRTEPWSSCPSSSLACTAPVATYREQPHAQKWRCIGDKCMCERDTA